MVGTVASRRRQCRSLPHPKRSATAPAAATRASLSGLLLGVLVGRDAVHDFSLGCWLICYPLAGQIGAGVSQVAAFAVLATVAGIGTFASLWLWPSHDPALVAHSHDDLPPDHAHMREDHDHGKTKSHAFVIDDIHPDWPRVA